MAACIQLKERDSTKELLSSASPFTKKAKSLSVPRRYFSLSFIDLNVVLWPLFVVKEESSGWLWVDNCQCLPNHFLKNPCTKLERIKHSASSAAPPPTGAILPPRTLVPNLSISVCMKSLGSMMLMLPFENNNQKDFKVKNARAQLHKSLKALSLTLLTLLPKTNIEMHYQRTSIHESLSHFFWGGAVPCGMQNLGSQAKDRACAPTSDAHSLNHWTTGEVPTCQILEKEKSTCASK